MNVEWAPRAKDVLGALTTTVALDVVRASFDCVFPPRSDSPYEGVVSAEERVAWRRAITREQIDEFEALVEEDSSTGNWDYVLVYREVGPAGRWIYGENDIRIERVLSNKEIASRWDDGP